MLKMQTPNGVRTNGTDSMHLGTATATVKKSYSEKDSRYAIIIRNHHHHYCCQHYFRHTSLRAHSRQRLISHETASVNLRLSNVQSNDVCTPKFIHMTENFTSFLTSVVFRGFSPAAYNSLTFRSTGSPGFPVEWKRYVRSPSGSLWAGADLWCTRHTVINRAVGCHYFPPEPRLPSHLQSVAAPGWYQFRLFGEQRKTSIESLHDSGTAVPFAEGSWFPI